MKKVIIVCYAFPPYPGIGGRRWAKFAKELCNKGYKVFVISAENPFSESSQWTKDIEDKKNISVSRLPLKYPKSLLGDPATIIEKILYRLSILWMKLLSKGNYYDRTVLWEMQLNEKLKSIISEEQCANVIVSGAPFHLMYYVSQLKKENPNLNIISDFRDFWTPYSFFMGLALLSKKRYAEEIRREKAVIDLSDHVTGVSDEIIEHYNSVGTNKTTHFVKIENGYDKEDVEKLLTTPPKNDKIRFVFTGALYHKLEYIMQPFLDALLLLKKNDIEKYNLLHFEFYGNIPAEYPEMIKKTGVNNVHFNKPIPLEEVYKKIGESHIGMLFLIEKAANTQSTKFYEYLAMKKKIIVFSNPGNTSDFIVKNNLGYAAAPADILKVLEKIIIDFKKDQLVFNSSFDTEKYSVQKLTDKLIGCLK